MAKFSMKGEWLSFSAFLVSMTATCPVVAVIDLPPQYEARFFIINSPGQGEFRNYLLSEDLYGKLRDRLMADRQDEVLSIMNLTVYGRADDAMWIGTFLESYDVKYAIEWPNMFDNEGLLAAEVLLRLQEVALQ